MLKKSALNVAVLGFSLIASGVYAEQSAITRTVMQKAEFPGDKYASMMVSVDIVPGGKVPLHTHPGIEMSYVVAGDGELSVEGQPDKRVKTGDSFQVPAGAPHSFVNLNSDKPEKLIVTYVVEKDKPLTTMAQK